MYSWLMVLSTHYCISVQKNCSSAAWCGIEVVDLRDCFTSKIIFLCDFDCTCSWLLWFWACGMGLTRCIWACTLHTYNNTAFKLSTWELRLGNSATLLIHCHTSQSFRASRSTKYINTYNTVWLRLFGNASNILQKVGPQCISFLFLLCIRF